MTHSESHRLLDQSDPDSLTWESICERAEKPHFMVSIKTSSEMVPYVEQCVNCKWIDSRALEQAGHSIIKRSLSERAGRLAVAIETEPFAFVQSSQEEPDLAEILGQALGAASMCWERKAMLGVGVFDSTRAKAIFQALANEIARFQRLAMEDAATRAVDEVHRLLNHDGVQLNEHLSEAALMSLRRAVEGSDSNGTDRVKNWSDLAYELYGMACNVGQGDLKTQTQEWRDCFQRLQSRFHELLP